MSTRPFVRLAAGLLVAGLLVLHLAAAAAARVTIDAAVPRGDGSVDLVLSLSRGCDGAATSGLVAALPDGTAVVAVEDPRGWSHEVEAGRVSWAGPAIPAGEDARFVVTARVDAVPGDTVLVPATQLCGGGAEVEWSDATDDAEHPAPRFVATASIVDPRARPVAVPSEQGGAGPVGVSVAVAAFVGLSLALVVRRGRRQACSASQSSKL
jgi:uncharacterized protein YcnI